MLAKMKPTHDHETSESELILSSVRHKMLADDIWRIQTDFAQRGGDYAAAFGNLR